jgi:hypothetical protein
MSFPPEIIFFQIKANVGPDSPRVKIKPQSFQISQNTTKTAQTRARNPIFTRGLSRKLPRQTEGETTSSVPPRASPHRGSPGPRHLKKTVNSRENMEIIAKKGKLSILPRPPDLRSCSSFWTILWQFGKRTKKV